MWMTLLLGCDLFAEPPAVEWEIEPADLGEPRSEGTGFSADDGTHLGAAFPQVMPGWAEGLPTRDVPEAVWAIALHERVADAGSCPYRELEGSLETYRTNCRSQDGYNWSGTVSADAWEEAGVEYTRFEFDLDVEGDVTDAMFTSLSMHGATVLAEGNTVTHVDTNLSIGLVGYFEARGEADDPRTASWADWTTSGTVELAGDTFGLDLAADVGGTEGFRLTGAGLVAASDCPVEPSGEAEMSDSISVEFQGKSECDACATVHGPDGDTEACAPK